MEFAVPMKAQSIIQSMLSREVLGTTKYPLDIEEALISDMRLITCQYSSQMLPLYYSHTIARTFKCKL